MKLDNHRSQEGCQEEDDATYTVVTVLLFLHGCCLFSTKEKPWPSTWSMNFFVLYYPKLEHMQESFNSRKVFMEHKHQCHNSSVPTKLGQMEERLAITQTAENHATLTEFITHNPKLFFSFFLFFLFLYHGQFHKLIPNFRNSTFSWMKPPSY